MRIKEWDRLKKILLELDTKIYDEHILPKRAEDYVYAVVELLTQCRLCLGKGYHSEFITESNGGESAPEWAGEYEVQCECSYQMPIRDEIAYERWQREGGKIDESKDCNLVI
tara:strand:+ start:6929 stop:7264 length:336 start_codon:yes stop_codon:yes gene_type:complete